MMGLLQIVCTVKIPEDKIKEQIKLKKIYCILV